jgi:ABC-2 type transport system ATP-binding protein
LSTGLAVDGVGYRYRRARAALSDVSWVPGRRAALLGPNGAGKTTLFGVSSGALRSAGGSVLVGGQPVRPGRVAWMPQAIQALPALRCQEQVALAGWLNGLGRSAAWAAATEALAAVDLEDRADEPARSLSGGQLRRLGVAEVLVAQPSVLLLDEPTVGLDPLQRDQLRTLIAGLGDRCQVIVATHLIDDLATSFDSITVLAEGEIRFHGDPDAFLDLAGGSGSFTERATEAYATVVGASR